MQIYLPDDDPRLRPASHRNNRPTAAELVGSDDPTPDPRSDPRFNALKHGLCADPDLIPLEPEEQAKFDKLHATWRKNYGNPAEDEVLSQLILRVVEAEWHRRFVQREFDLYLSHNRSNMLNWDEQDHKNYARLDRYVTSAERKFQRAYKMLESHCKFETAKQDRAEKRARAEAERKTRAVQTAIDEEAAADEAEIKRRLAKAREIRWFQDTSTGEMVSLCGKYREPGPPDWVPQKIVPGEYGPYDPSNIEKTIRAQYAEEKRLRKEREALQLQEQQPETDKAA